MSAPSVPGSDFADMALLIRGFQLSRMIQVAVALDLAGHLMGGPLSAVDLALKAGADPGMLLRLCRALAAFGIFEVDAEDLICQSVRSDCLRREATPTLYHAARYWGTPHVWGGWANLEHAVSTGESAIEPVTHMPHFEYLKQHPEEAELLNLFMQHSPDDRQAAVVSAYDFSSCGLVVDVGGGNGALLAAILKSNANVRGLLFDQEAVVAGAAQNLAAFAGRVEVQAGSFFETIPSGGDIYILSLVLHNWDDKRCLSILANIRAAMRVGRRLLVIQQVLGQEKRPPNLIGYLTDMHMMVILHGRERSLKEFASLFHASGFGEPQIHYTRSPFCVVEALSV